MKLKQSKEGVYYVYWKDDHYPVGFWVVLHEDFKISSQFLVRYQKLTQNPEYFATIVKDLWLIGDQSSIDGCTSDVITSDGGLNVVFFLKPNTSPSTVAHECIHAICYVYKYVGIKLDLDNDEPMAYFMSNLMDKIMDVYIQYNQYKEQEDGNIQSAESTG